MNYLEKNIVKQLALNNLELSDKTTLKDVADYIDRKNEYTDGIYDVIHWICDTKRNYPEYLVDVNKIVDELIPHLIEQINLCYDQTGLYPNLEDFQMYLDSEDVPIKIDIPTLLRILLKLCINH